MRRRLLTAAAIASLAFVTAPVAAGASTAQNTPPHGGCPQAYDMVTNREAAIAIYPILADPSRFPTIDDLVASVAANDTNKDGLVCLKFMGSSVHYGVPFAIVHDNVANASDS